MMGFLRILRGLKGHQGGSGILERNFRKVQGSLRELERGFRGSPCSLRMFQKSLRFSRDFEGVSGDLKGTSGRFRSPLGSSCVT